MSQIAKAIVATDTGNRVHIRKELSPLFQDVFSAKAETRKDFDIGIMYRIGCTLGAQCIVTPDLTLKHNQELEQAVLRTKQQVIEAVFGEFRPHIRRIEKAIYDYKYEEAGKLLYEMERQMFEPE